MIRFRVVQSVVDVAKVQQWLDARTRSAFMTLGAAIRRTAMQSLRRGTRRSKPGEPPVSRTGLLRRSILFAWDARRRGVVVGAVPIAARSKAIRAAGGLGPATVAAALEFGGTTRTADGRTMVIAARPFMRPALRNAFTIEKVRRAIQSAR